MQTLATASEFWELNLSKILHVIKDSKNQVQSVSNLTFGTREYFNLINLMPQSPVLKM